MSTKAKRISLRLAGTWLTAPVIWYAMAMGFSSIVWHFCHGRPVLGPYGRDKSLSNLAVELPAVMVLTTVWFPLSSPGAEARWWPKAAWIVALVAGVVTILVPGLPE